MPDPLLISIIVAGVRAGAPWAMEAFSYLNSKGDVSDEFFAQTKAEADESDELWDARQQAARDRIEAMKAESDPE